MIRLFTPEDTGSVMDIWLSASIHSHDFISSSYWREQFSVVRDRYLPVSVTYVFVKEDRVCGFLSVLDGNTIGALFVAPDCQGRGVGSALIRHVQESTDDLMLCVYVENSAARMFYEKRGFAVLSRCKTETDHDEYVMRWVASS
ncbi:MAG TPA: N-acetyltransferase [Methanocorpusculum sp.]|nr:N-acetyltransferase [Methanocorpusculum sp.]HJK80350.1 N-acetyltransferase [Methanocorpusculum sp.]